jgi:hypothetical protein
MASENLCTNPSFEYDTTGWSSTGTITRVPNGYIEHFALQAVLTTNQSVSYTMPFNPSSVTHSASIYVYNTEAVRVLVTLQVTGSGTLASRTYTIEPNRWKRIEVSFIGTNVSTTMNIIASSTCTLKLDGCQIEVSSVGATTYFDGNSLGTQQDNQIQYQQYGWIGDTHNSKSFRNRQVTNGGQIIDLQSYGFQLVSISGAGNPTFENAILTFASTDGGILQDTVVPPRDVTMIGRISASSKTELHQRLQRFMELFQRDQVSYYQPRSWRFQHMSGRQPIGQELSFSGVLVSVVAADLTDQLSVDVAIQLNMIDPYFYGHDVSVQASSNLFFGTSGSPIVFDWIDSYQVNNSISNTTQGRFVFNGSINDMVTYNGRCYIVGAFTSITDTVTSTVYNHSYWTTFDSQTNTFIAPPAVINGIIRCLDISANGKYVVFGGDFTLVGAQTCNRIAMYTVGSNSFSRIHPTYIGVNNSVYDVVFGQRIKGTTWDYNFYFGGTFTSGDVVGTLNRLAFFDTQTRGVGITPNFGVNNDVYTVSVDEYTNTLSFGGIFLASTSGINMRRIGAYNIRTGIFFAFNFGLDGTVDNIVFKQSGEGYICGNFSFFLVNSTGASAGSCSQLLKFSGTTLSSLPVASTSADFVWISQPVVQNIRTYQEGVTYTRNFMTTSIRYTYYYNESNGITTQLPLSGSSVRHHDVQLNRTYYTIASGLTRATPKPFSITCDSTTKSKVFFRLRLLSQYSATTFTDDNISILSGLQNLTNLDSINFAPNASTNPAVQVIEMFPRIYFGDVIIFDSRIGLLQSFYYNLLQRIIPSSAVYSLAMLPGINVFQVYIIQGNYNLSVTSPEVVLGYTQTYQNIFDGINRI